MAFIVAITGLKGGVGRTTLAANLASAVVQAGRRAAAVDLDPQNGLGHHFGRGLAFESGITDPDGEIRALDRRDTRGEATCIPFGNPTPEAADLAEQELMADVGWLRRRLLGVIPAGCELVLLDTPGYRSPWSLRALELADLVLSVVSPDPACYATLPAMEALLRQTRSGRPEGLGAHYVINHFDAGSAPCRDVVAALRGSFPERIAPALVHADQSVRDALGRQRTLVREASNSQALADIVELGDWMFGALGTRVEARPVRAAAGSRS
jgi:cellulose synthase operon protein YhjQ